MTKGFLLATVAAATFISTSPAAGQHRPGATREFAYFLPRTRAVVRVDQVIRRCPTREQHSPLIVSTAAVVDRVGADPAALIRVDASSGFLSGRTTRLTLRPDGTLISFNASTAGEGGAVLSSLISVASTVASLGFGVPAGALAGDSVGIANAPPPPPPPPFKCKREIRELVDQMRQVEQDLASLKSQIAQGSASDGAAEVLAALNSELSSLTDRLTLSTDPHIFDPQPAHYRPAKDGDPAPDTIIHLKEIDYTPWFTNYSSDDDSDVDGETLREWLGQRGVPGGHGFRASLKPNRAILNVLSPGDGGTAAESNPTPRGAPPTPYLYYRRPVPGVVALVPCAAPAVGEDCKPDETRPGAAASVQKTVHFPQLSGLFSIRIGRGGIFGTRRAVAEFDGSGAPTTLEYGSTSGGAQIAGVINSAEGAVTTLRDARTDAISRKLEREKLVDELRTLLEAREADADGE